jgi:hypothetical protein
MFALHFYGIEDAIVSGHQPTIYDLRLRFCLQAHSVIYNFQMLGQASERWMSVTQRHVVSGDNQPA